MGSHSGFWFSNPYFSLEKLENIETLISTLQGDNSQWELSSWPTFSGSCVCYTVISTCIFFYPPSLLFIYVICLSLVGIGLCNPLLCRDAPSHTSLPVQILVVIHGSSQMSTSLSFLQESDVSSPSFEYSRHFL